jgi:hypothetical protein
MLSSNFTDLDLGTCDLMMQMRFEPARDRSGRPIPSQFSRPVTWLLADERPFASSSIRARVTISNGRKQSCEILRGEGAYIVPWSALACGIFGDVGYYFGTSADRSLNAIIEARLDAGDGASLLNEPWPSGNPLAVEKVSFEVNRSGDPTGCAPLEGRGFGERGLNNLSPCGRLLSILWFKTRPNSKKALKGTFETRVYALTASAQTNH